MRKALILALALAGCGPSAGNESRAEQAVVPVAPPRPPAQTWTLTGLYETPGAPPSQVCVLQQGERARFGLVTRQSGRAGCSGAGAAVRRGDDLTLTMDGESPCTIAARVRGRAVTFPAALPRGCAYYCAPGATLAALALTKTGGRREDALRARDLVGDPLCG
ncbi:MAG TPA: hypothetical protein VEX35_06140 [Allosphingosinicella sp.]|nr:hypothetical protein [Allosphingosinicella sp.]